MIQNGVSIANGTRTGNLFQLNKEANTNWHTKSYLADRDFNDSSHTTKKIPRAPTHLWHQRLGHLPYRAIMTLQELGALKSLGTSNLNSCQGCALGKMARRSFNNEPRPRRARKIGELIHSDVGCWDIPGIGGFKYYVTFIDDFSRFISIYPISQKSKFFKNSKNLPPYYKPKASLIAPLKASYPITVANTSTTSSKSSVAEWASNT